MSCTLEEKVLKIKKSKTTAYVTIYILTTCHRLTGADKILGMVRKTFSFMNKDMLQQLLNLKVHIYTLYPIYSSDNATETSRHGGEYSCRCHGKRVISAPSIPLKLKLARHII